MHALELSMLALGNEVHNFQWCRTTFVTVPESPPKDTPKEAAVNEAAVNEVTDGSYFTL